MALKRFTSILSGKRNPFDRSEPEEIEDIEGDTPEANIARSVKLFCESGTRESTIVQGEEVLQLPVIVESAESSPPAAAVAATHIRKFLSQQNSSRPLVQYNAVMLMRILVDNPGPTFTRNVDAKFVSTIKDVLRNSREQSVQQILRETLMTMYREKAYDTNLSNLFAMWQKESGTSGNAPGPQGVMAPGSMDTWNGASTQRSGYQSRRKGLPSPGELAQRIEEARTSAKLLQQLVQSTPQADLRSNDLIKEFAERCQAAQRSIQGYISADDPMPDDETMQTLIETSEQLSLAMSKHSRALLQARRAAAGSGGNSPSATPPLLPSRLEDQTNNNNSRFPSSATYAPSGQTPEPHSTYSPPPLPPTTFPRRDVAANHPPPDSAYTYSPPPIPPPGKVAGPIEEDPFADEHATGGGDLYDSHNHRPLTPPGTRPAMQNITSSYVRRQDDAEENLTMHGARDSAPVSPDRGTAEGHRSGTGEISPLDPKIKSR